MFRSESDFLQFAFKHYDNPRLVSVEEFNADIKRITHLNTLLRRYTVDRFDLKRRLILNHVVILGNCFSPQGAIQMMEYKIQEECRVPLNTILYYLNWIDCSKSGLDFWLLDQLKQDEN